MKKLKQNFLLLLSAVLVSSLITYSCGSSVTEGLTSSMGLVNQLSNLGVSTDQAVGGLASLMGLAKNKLSVEDYAKLGSTVFPDINKVMSSAKTLGINPANMKSLTDVQNAFKTLGMKATDVSKFVPAITNFATTKGGGDMGKLLSDVFK